MVLLDDLALEIGDPELKLCLGTPVVSILE
jgi:hypothetical protein